MVDPDGKLLGIITLDDALEVSIPRDWFRRRGNAPLKRRQESE